MSFDAEDLASSADFSADLDEVDDLEDEVDELGDEVDDLKLFDDGISMHDDAGAAAAHKASGEAGARAVPRASIFIFLKEGQF